MEVEPGVTPPQMEAAPTRAQPSAVRSAPLLHLPGEIAGKLLSFLDSAAMMNLLQTAKCSACQTAAFLAPLGSDLFEAEPDDGAAYERDDAEPPQRDTGGSDGDGDVDMEGSDEDSREASRQPKPVSIAAGAASLGDAARGAKRAAMERKAGDNRDEFADAEMQDNSTSAGAGTMTARRARNEVASVGGDHRATTASVGGEHRDAAALGLRPEAMTSGVVFKLILPHAKKRVVEQLGLAAHMHKPVVGPFETRLHDFAAGDALVQPPDGLQRELLSVAHPDAHDYDEYPHIVLRNLHFRRRTVRTWLEMLAELEAWARYRAEGRHSLGGGGAAAAPPADPAAPDAITAAPARSNSSAAASGTAAGGSSSGDPVQGIEDDVPIFDNMCKLREKEALMMRVFPYRSL
jgi:hypothetical protein